VNSPRIWEPCRRKDQDLGQVVKYPQEIVNPVVKSIPDLNQWWAAARLALSPCMESSSHLDVQWRNII